MYRHPVEDEIRFTDRFGDEKVIHRTTHGLQVKRTNVTPALALNQEIAVLIGQRVRALREERGMSLEALCIKAGIVSATPKSRMWEIENAVRKQGVRIGTLYALAMALGVPVRHLLPSVDEVRHVAGVKTRHVAAVRLAE